MQTWGGSWKSEVTALKISFEKRSNNMNDSIYEKEVLRYSYGKRVDLHLKKKSAMNFNKKKEH